MKILACLLMFLPGAFALQGIDLHQVRKLYMRAPEAKQDAGELNRLMLRVDTSATPLLVCYKGANEMLQAKYSLNPVVKFKKFKRGKYFINKAFSRDTLDLEMRFIRFSIQSNLPAFLGYRDELGKDKRFLLAKIKDSKEPELKEMIFNYFSGLAVFKPEELKQLKN